MVVISGLFASFADRREREAWQPADGPYLHGNNDEIWIDYIADLGDGWNSTATMASLLAAEQLTPQGCEQALPHGRLLIMGGDQVYPSASASEYRARLEAPYYSVHPRSPDDQPRTLFALPGNHDWYDGLAAFSRLFLQQRWFAGWKTQQTRSYFVMQLPQRWWLVAVDSQLDSDIDTAQLQYLLHATRDLAVGDNVILASAVPFWLQDDGESQLRHNMAFLTRELAEKRGAHVRLALAGDLHHYTRYQNDDGAQRITAGGGGAFLHGTAWLPTQVCDEDQSRWQQEKTFPTAARSRLELWRLLLFPLFNPAFSIFLGALASLLLWGADSASHGIFFGNASQGSVLTIYYLLATLPTSPLFALAFFGWFAGFIVYADSPRLGPTWFRQNFRFISGFLHAVLQLFVAIAVLSYVMPSRLFDLPGFLGVLLEMVLLIALIGGFLFGVWTWLLYQLLGCHRDTAWSACRIPDWKNFLRMHIAADGKLTVYVIGVPKVCVRWIERRPTASNSARAMPADGVSLNQRAVLIERVVIDP